MWAVFPSGGFRKRDKICHRPPQRAINCSLSSLRRVAPQTKCCHLWYLPKAPLRRRLVQILELPVLVDENLRKPAQQAQVATFENTLEKKVVQLSNGERGFTLIELLTTISVVGILAAIAIGHYSRFQARAFNARAEHDMRSAITAEEAYFSDFETYAPCADAGCQAALEGFVLSDGVVITITTLLTDSVYQVSARHPGGDRSYGYDSQTGSFTLP